MQAGQVEGDGVAIIIANVNRSLDITVGFSEGQGGRKQERQNKKSELLHGPPPGKRIYLYFLAHLESAVIRQQVESHSPSLKLLYRAQMDAVSLQLLIPFTSPRYSSPPLFGWI